MPHNPSPTWQDLKPGALNTHRPCTGTRNHTPEATWHSTEVPARQGTLPAPAQQGALALQCHLLLLPPSLHSSSASYHSCQQLIQERAKAPAVSCFGGLRNPPHFCRKSQRGVRARGREHQWPYCAGHILLAAEAPSPPVGATGQRAGEGRGCVPYLGHCTGLPVPGCSIGAPPLSTGQRR